MFRAQTLLEGKWPILILVGLSVAAGLWWVPALVVPGLLLVFTISFFRDPQRVIPADPQAIVSAADGKVVEIRTTPTGPMVAIFLSVFNVHTQRAPVAGRITAVSYHPGKFLDVRNPKCSVENENRVVVITGADGFQVTVRQIAGLIARRIVAWKVEGDTLAKGEHLGMIRFGSRVELSLPAGTEILVKIGDVAKGGETIVARRR